MAPLRAAFALVDTSMITARPEGYSVGTRVGRTVGTLEGFELGSVVGCRLGFYKYDRTEHISFFT